MYKGHESIVLNDSIYIEHISKMSNLKKYWKQKPWFEKEDSEEAIVVKNRIAQLNSDFGPEPQGLARACNDECNIYQINITNKNPGYVNFYK
jgi:hypothetical protein